MYCKECGREIDDDSKFCSGCGKAVIGGSVRDRRDDTMGLVDEIAAEGIDDPLISAEPVFIHEAALLSCIPMGIFFGIWGGIFFGIPIMMIRMFTMENPEFTVIPFILMGMLCMVAFPMIIYFYRLKTYQHTEYKFYPDRLEYTEGFMTAVNKVVKYSQVAEVSLRRGIIQRKYDLGTIYLATRATAGEGKNLQSGIKISDIRDSEKIYQRVKNIIQ